MGDPAANPLLDLLTDSLGDSLARRDPAALSSRNYISDPADDTLMPRSGTSRGVADAGLSGDSLSERDALAGRDPLAPLAPTQKIIEREARARQNAGTLYPLSGVRTNMADEWRSVFNPLGPLDEPAKPYQAESSMQSAPGMQTQSQSACALDIGDERLARSGADVGRHQANGPIGPNTMPNEYMEYEEDFRADYATCYAASGEPYETYQSAYRYGATLGNDDRFRNRAWDDQMEYKTCRDWESRHPQGAETWDRFKAAIRHGWDRVTGHHHV